MKKPLERALQFEEEYKSRKRTKFLTCIDPFMTYLPILLHSKINKSSSKQLLLGLTLSMEGVIKGESKLGIYSPDFDKTCDLVARALIKLTAEINTPPEVNEMNGRVLKKLIMGGLSTQMGLLWLAIDDATKVEEEKEEINKDLFIELLLKTLYTSEVPLSLLRVFSEASGVEKEVSEKSAVILETLSILFCLLAFSNSVTGKDLLESFNSRLIRNIEIMEQSMSDSIIEKHLDKSSMQPLRLFLGQGKEALINKNYERFLKGLNDLCKPYGIKTENLKQDIQACRKLYATLGTQISQTSARQESFHSILG